MGNPVANQLRDALLQKLKPKEKELVERVRSQVRDLQVEESLRKFTRDNKDYIQENDLLISLSKLNANLHIKDINDLITVLKHGKEGDDVKLSIAETVQLIGQ